MPLSLPLARVGELEVQETGWPPIMVGDLTVMADLSGETSLRAGERRSFNSDKDGRVTSGVEVGGLVRGTGAA
jgi:hypothetical protein